MTESILEQAHLLYKVIKGESDSDIGEHVDELLAFLYKIVDASKKSHAFVIYNQSLKEIIYGLESNPDFTIQQPEVREKLLVFLNKLLKVE